MSLSKRILIDICFLVLMVFAPWYVLVMLGLLVFWKSKIGSEWLEIIAFGLIMDIVYASNSIGSSSALHTHVSAWRGFGWIPYLPFTYWALIAVWVLSLIKKRIR